MISKRRIAGYICGALVIAFAALSFYSYRCLLAIERRFISQLGVVSTHDDRRVSFHLFEPWSGTCLPHWTVTYHEEPVTDINYIDPSLTVDLFGGIANTTSKELFWAVEFDKLQHQ
jgi:hypothetical protein